MRKRDPHFKLGVKETSLIECERIKCKVCLFLFLNFFKKIYLLKLFIGLLYDIIK